jgi:hypothetical protein
VSLVDRGRGLESIEWRQASRRAPAWAITVLVASALGVAALIALWVVDARHGWETPRWSERRFDSIAVGSPRWREPGERWVVAVFPQCSHCRASLRDVALVRARMSHPPRLAALIVDTERRPPAAVVADAEVDAVFWDREQVWRKRWGHRAYGEILCFDSAGRYLRTRTASEIGAEVPDK